MSKMSNLTDLENQYRFDSFCRTVLKNKARDIYRSNRRYNERFVSLDYLPQETLNRQSTQDVYETDLIHFYVENLVISIENMLLADAIKTLSKTKQKILLLSFFSGMKDLEIAKILEIRPSTVFYHKNDALKKVKKYMEEHREYEK